MSDRIVLSGVRGRGFHGVFEHERREGQEFVVDVALTVDLAAAGVAVDRDPFARAGQLRRQRVDTWRGPPGAEGADPVGEGHGVALSSSATRRAIRSTSASDSGAGSVFGSVWIV